MSDTEPRSPRPTLLVVDDTPQNLSLISEILAVDYTVKLAPSGARALTIAATSMIDLILLDIMMPEMDGYEVCRRLKADPKCKAIPVIFVTAVTEASSKEKGLLLGAVDYLTKPVEPDVLLSCVQRHLALHLRSR
ncbi:MAG: response regulator [Betaproteobacteria bacterium]|nr:response regulator [Betaproteobacteria bacterium]